MQNWGKVVVWALLLGGVWGTFEANQEERTVVAIMSVRAAMLAWCKSETAAGNTHTQIDNITRKMIGTGTAPTLKLKAMETYGFLPFLLVALRRYQDKVEHAHILIEAGDALFKMVVLMKSAPNNLAPVHLQEQLCDVVSNGARSPIGAHPSPGPVRVACLAWWVLRDVVGPS
jgi:hypothetical protein